VLYLVQTAATEAALALGFALAFLDNVALALVVFGCGVLSMFFFLRPRAAGLHEGSEWPVQEWNAKAREFRVLSPRYAVAAFEDRGAPGWLGFVPPTAAALAVVCALAMNASDFFG
jgi:hypothetical protein